MKIGIINPNIIENDPYVGYYTDIFDKLGIDYKYIGWNRNKVYPASYKNEKAEIFQYYAPESNSSVKKIHDFWLFSRFVIKCLNKDHYNLLTVHTLSSILFLNHYLKKKYLKRFILDIRDYSPIYPLIKGKVKNVIHASAFTTISSSAYKTWLPAHGDYVMGHNIKKAFVENALNTNPVKQRINKEKVVLTIGQINCFSSNARLISSLGNKPNIAIVFAGYGPEKERLEKFAKGKFSNVFFSGRYKKEDEAKIVETADFINIVLLNNDIMYKTLMSNRFYLSIIHKIPMIVNEESAQAKWVHDYKLGLVVSSKDDIYEKLMDYMEHYNFEEFNEGCTKLLGIVNEDIQEFERRIIHICKEYN